MDYHKSLKYLQTVQGENLKLVLENIQKVCDRLPFDTAAMNYIQVAGTNGKGSTSAYLASALQLAGFRVGLFTSPHLQEVCERIAVNGRFISRSEFASGLTQIKSLCASLVEQKVIPNLPTFFEHLFLLALLHFHKKKVQWVVLEVGLGGRLDATSTIKPRIAVITNISKDHTNILGRTIAEIAGEKAGIIRAGVPVVCGCQPRDRAYPVIKREAANRGAPFHPVFDGSIHLTWKDENSRYRCLYREAGMELPFTVSMRGEHQCRNAAIAIKTLSLLRNAGVNIPQRAIAEGIRQTKIPGRIEYIKPGRGYPAVLIDGGHNPEGIRALAGHLKREDAHGETLIFGVLKDKDYRTMAKLIAPFAGQVILTQPPSPRALAPEKLSPLFSGKTVLIEKDLSRALAVAKKIKKDIIITGSLYLAGGMRTLIMRRKSRERQPL